MFGDFSIPSLLQWIPYHRYHAGMDHFILYDTGAPLRNPPGPEVKPSVGALLARTQVRCPRVSSLRLSGKPCLPCLAARGPNHG